nr:hypothetical protein [Tanacetum cinerariifolium]
MTYANQGATEQQNASHLFRFEQEKEDAHVTLKLVLDTQKTRGPAQSFYVSSDFISKFLNLDNPPTDNKIASVMDTTTYHPTTIHEITSSFTTPTPPPILLFNPLSQQATPTPTPTTSETTTSLSALLDFVSVLKFNERVTNLEKDLSEIKQVDQYAQALFSIPTIVDPATLFEFELAKTLIVNMEKNKSFDVADYKRELYNASIKSYNTDKDIFKLYGMKRRKSSKDAESSRDSRSKGKTSLSTSKDTSQSRHKSFSKSAHAEEPSYTVEDSGMQQDQEFITRDNDEQPADKERRTIAVTRLKIMKKYDYGHLKEIEVYRDDQHLYTFKEGDFKRLRLQDIGDMLLLLVQQKLPNLIIDKRLNRRDLPRDIPLDSVVVLRYEKRSKSKNKGRVQTEMELVLEQTQQDSSYEVSVSAEGVEELKRKVKIKGERKESLLTLRKKPAATLFEFELTKTLIVNMEKNKSFDVADYKRELYNASIKSYNTDKHIFKLYGKVFLLKRSRDEKNKINLNRRDLPRDIPLDSVVVLRYEKRSKSKNKGRAQTEMELVLEQTQQNSSYEVSVSAEGVEELKRKVNIKVERKESLLTLRKKHVKTSAVKNHKDDC